MILGKMQIITSTELKVWAIKQTKEQKMTPDTMKIQQLKTQIAMLRIENNESKKDNKLLKQVIVILTAGLIGIVAIAMTCDKNYNLGKAVLENGICVERPLGYECETPDNFVFIEK